MLVSNLFPIHPNSGSFERPPLKLFDDQYAHDGFMGDLHLDKFWQQQT